MHQVFTMGILLVILFLGLIVFLCFLLPDKGELAEIRVHNLLIELPEEYHVIDNVIIGNNYYSSQIDHVVVSPYGVFVIETKGYKGWIYGSENAQYWTQNIFGKKYQLYNPILQNQGHVNSLNNLLGIPKDRFVPIVCFNNDASLYISAPNSIVINRRRLKKTLLSYTATVISSDEKEKIISTITSHMKVGKEAEKVHRFNANNKVKSSNEAIRNGICPRCGGQIIKRQGKYGYFYGCSNYPKCRFTMKVK